jgi:hypothetical protein
MCGSTANLVASLQLARNHVGLGRAMDSTRLRPGDGIPGNASIRSASGDIADAIDMASCGLVSTLRETVVSGESVDQLLCRFTRIAIGRNAWL